MAAGRSLSTRALVVALKALWVAFVIATPLLGAWVASSLAAYVNGPVVLAAACGLFLFPLLPLAWEAYSHQRYKLATVKKPRILTFGDRLIFRTLIINLVFLAGLLATKPEGAFTALSTRGDWMLDGRHSSGAEKARRALFRSADALEWLYLAAHDNPYAKDDKGKNDGPSDLGSSTPPPPPASPTASATVTPSPAPVSSGDPTPVPAAPTQVAWPLANEMHPVVAAMQSSEELNPTQVARYLADRERDPVRLAKAVHDYVADRIAYDAIALETKKFPPQNAEAVFAAKKGVCAGYSQLFAAIAKSAGLEAAYVVGDARTRGQEEHGEPHAWNAVKLDGRWWLLDVTWDSGTVDGETFKKRYRTDYFLAPAEVFGLEHFPDDAKWQLRPQAISRGDFMRQPMMAPRFFAQGFELLSPDRSQVSVHGSLSIAMKNPRGMFALLDVVEGGAEQKSPCVVVPGELLSATCTFPQPGSYQVKMFSNKERFGDYDYIGQLEVNSN